MGFNLLWFLPLSAWLLFVSEGAALSSAYPNLVTFYHRSSWDVCLSPSAGVFFSAVAASIGLPIQPLWLIPSFVFNPSGDLYRRRYVWSAAIMGAVVISGFVVQFIIWGSFPLPVDSEGYVRIRMVPFFPWPTTI
jgi:hypothetical protein